MKISGTLDLRILAQERWIQVAHSLHSIMGLPAKGFRQKQVIRSQASSSGQGETDVGQKLPHCCGLSPAMGHSTTSEATASPAGRTPPLTFCFGVRSCCKFIHWSCKRGKRKCKSKDQISKAPLQPPP